MKKTIKLVAVVMVIAMLALSLVACGKSLSGKYSATFDIGLYETTTTYEFGLFGKVTRTVTQEVFGGEPDTVVTEGKYEIMEDPENPESLIIAFEFEGEERTTASLDQGTENGTKYIKIGGRQYFEVK